MQLNTQEFLLLTIAIAIGAIATRFLPFIIFSGKHKLPELVKYLGQALTPAIMGFLVVYCLRNTQVSTEIYLVPEFIAILSLVVIHYLKHNFFLSISTSTAIYMCLVQQAI